MLRIYVWIYDFSTSFSVFYCVYILLEFFLFVSSIHKGQEIDPPFLLAL